MVITILKAQVAPENAAALENAYNEAIKYLDAGLQQSYLLRDAANPTRWEILTIWESREALQAMRNSGETPRGVQVFRAAGVEPELSVFLVPAHIAAQGLTK
jgi:heme-degrading monooxygenase HmoA